ncbi:hypothetical protein LIER_25015 [Lithospermum erythrorhizon]|uniref:Uncharacterized protein n=1 Tax=Lithospermum erythrorhizon TaxID=34254 RepID=A0AAV3R678_LITER
MTSDFQSRRRGPIPTLDEPSLFGGRGNQEGRNVHSQHVEVENILEEANLERVTENVEGVEPSVKDTSVETSYKSAKTHSSIDPTVA